MKIGFDIGGTKLHYIVLNGDKKLKDEIVPIAGMNKEEVLDIIASVINSVDQTNLEIGISSPTAVDTQTGFCKGMSGIKDYANFNLYEELRKRLKTKTLNIKAINDGKAGMLGIIKHNFTEKPHSAIMISLGTGIGGAIYIDGKIFQGIDNMAGEFGYPIWNTELKKNVSRSISPVNVFKTYFDGENGKDILDRYKNDKHTQTIIDAWLTDISRFLSILVFSINPEFVLFTGSISKNETFVNLLTNNFQKYMSENDFADLITSKLKFFHDEKINFNILGALTLI